MFKGRFYYGYEREESRAERGNSRLNMASRLDLAMGEAGEE